MELQQDACSIADMEQPVADFINSILMEEDDERIDSTTKPLCILDNDHDCALALYQAIIKDFFDILADNNITPNDRRCTTSSSSYADLQFRSLTGSGIDRIYGNYSTATDSLGGGDIQGEESSSSDCSFIEFGAWAEQVLSSASLVANADDFERVDVLELPAPSSTDAAIAGDTIHVDLLQEPSPAAQQNQRQTTQPAKMEERDFSFNEELGEVIQAECDNLYARRAYEDQICERKGTTAGSKRKGTTAGYYDLEELLLNCAQAVSRSENKKAMEILQELKRQGASPQGRSCLHRMAFHFCRALEARLDGSGAALYASERAAFNEVPAANFIRAWLRTFESLHYTKIFYFFANQSFLAAAASKAHVDRLHVIEYGISFGTQWAYLLKALSQRDGGSPLLFVLTGVQFPSKARAAETTGRRLAEFAAALKVPFRFHAVASTSSWEDLDAEALGIEAESISTTAVVVNIFRQLQFIPDETTVVHQDDEIYARLNNLPQGLNASQPSPREMLLSRIRSLNPELLIVGVKNAGLNVPTFLTRFKNALQHFSSLVEMMEVMTDDSSERRLMESLFTKSILNVVACEGTDRVVRPETYRQWERRLHRAGWEQLPVPAQLLRRSMEYVKERYHRDCTVMADHSSPWLLTAWRGRTYLATSAWRPAT